MKPMARLREDAGLDDSGLRAALRDARRGPSAEQVAALSAQLSQRIAEQTLAPSVAASMLPLILRRSALGLSVSVALLTVIGISLPQHQQTTPSRPEETAAVEQVLPFVNTPIEPEVESAAPPQLAPFPATPRRSARAPRSAGQQTPAVIELVAQDDEVGLLQRAQRALLARPELALSLVRNHQEQFQSSLFAEEREAIAVEALFRLGRRSEGEQRRQAFFDQYPKSTYGVRLQRLSSASPQL